MKTPYKDKLAAIKDFLLTPYSLKQSIKDSIKDWKAFLMWMLTVFIIFWLTDNALKSIVILAIITIYNIWNYKKGLDAGSRVVIEVHNEIWGDEIHLEGLKFRALMSQKIKTRKHIS